MAISRLPSHIQHLDISKLRGSQMWVLSDWLNCRRALQAAKSSKDRQEILKSYIDRDLEHAQKGYEIIFLQKIPKADGSGGVSPDLEGKLTSMLSDVLRAGGDDVMAKAEEAGKAAVATAVEGVKKDIGGLARAALKEAAEKSAPLVIQEGKKTRKVEGVLPPEFKRMVQLAAARIPMLLVGPAGCGKTYLCEKLGEALGLESSDQSCSEGMSESVFNGLLLPIGKGGAFEHCASPYMIRYENGGVMLLDELDAGDSNVFTYINKSIANESYTVAQRWLNPVVRKHKDFVLVAAANTYGSGADAMYVGRNQLDAATVDRFKVGMITMDYSREVEQSLASQELCDWAWRIRDAIRARKLRRIMSTRTIKSLQTMTAVNGWKQSDWEEAYFTGWSAEERHAVMGGV